MTTPVFLTGFEHGVATPTVNGGGLFDNVIGTGTIQSTVKNTGNYALYCNDATQKISVTKNIGTSAYTVARMYVNFAHLPTEVDGYCEILSRELSSTLGWLYLEYDTNNKKIHLHLYDGSTHGDYAIINTIENVWYCIDIKAYVGATTWTIDWYIDNVIQSSVSIPSKTATTFLSAFTIGGGSNTSTYSMYIDDVVISHTAADYPIGPGGTEAIVPTSDGTHNAGTNTMEDNTGADIGVTTAYNKINSIPPSATNYIRQATIGTSNYAEVLFGDIGSAHSAILGAIGILAYTSATTSANTGGCIISKDSFASNTVIWGVSGSLSDYSDGSTATLYYKSKLLSGVIDDTTVNALKARLGYSGDVTPNPYWIDLIVEVAYSISSNNNILLDLVSYNNTFFDINIIESEIVQLDLVSYSTIYLDLIEYDSTPVNLDLVSYNTTFYDINILESEIVQLDLVSYNTTLNDIEVIANDAIGLDLVQYSTIFNDINVLENEVTMLDLVVYNTIINDSLMADIETVYLDLVSYNIVINDIKVIDYELLLLELVSYSSTINDITLIESEIIPLELVSYSSTINAISIYEQEITYLDLVEYNTEFYSVSFEILQLIVTTPSERWYIIVNEFRVYSIEEELRTLNIKSEKRKYSIF